MAAQGPANRPRLGKRLTKLLGLIADPYFSGWYADGERVLWSETWGRWRPTPDDWRSHYHDDGEMPWASASWLDKTLARHGKRLVYEIRFSKYGSTRSYDETTGVKAIYVGLRTDNPNLRVWHAKRASKLD